MVGDKGKAVVRAILLEDITEFVDHLHFNQGVQ